MPTILLLSGPNLNLFGERQPEIYGTATLDDLVGDARAAAHAHGYEVQHVQSNDEGALIDAIQAARTHCAAIVINPGALGHTSYAIADALAAFEGPKVELHVSNPLAREPWRHTSVIGPYVTGTIQGFGGAGYHLAVIAAISQLPSPPRPDMTR
jgi:3-dehydroquinate dehydratase-2